MGGDDDEEEECVEDEAGASSGTVPPPLDPLRVATGENAKICLMLLLPCVRVFFFVPLSALV